MHVCTFCDGCTINTQLIMMMEKDEKFHYRRGIARRTMSVSSCYVSRSMGVRKVLSRKSDLSGHSNALAVVPFDRPHTINY